MALELKPLLLTRFLELDLRSLHVATRIPGDEQARMWKAVAEDRRGLLVTQLLGSSGEMRDGTYHYLVAANRHLYVVRDGGGDTRIVESGSDGSYPQLGARPAAQDIVAIAKEAIRMLIEDARTPAPEKRLLGPDGLPVRKPEGDV